VAPLDDVDPRRRDRVVGDDDATGEPVAERVLQRRRDVAGGLPAADDEQFSARS
jgi:hypothetical protein